MNWKINEDSIFPQTDPGNGKQPHPKPPPFFKLQLLFSYYSADHKAMWSDGGGDAVMVVEKTAAETRRCLPSPSRGGRTRRPHLPKEEWRNYQRRHCARRLTLDRRGKGKNRKGEEEPERIGTNAPF